MSERSPRLIVLPPSHFCERARWALDRAGIAYTEERWAAGIHVPLARRLAPGTSLPILDTGKEIIQGSDRILDWTALPGGDPSSEQRFEKRIGPLVSRYLYAAMLNDPRAQVRTLLLDGVPFWQAALGRLAWPATRRAMIAGMDARPARVPALAHELEVELTWFDDHLAGRAHLVGDHFGRADITAASLLAPLARPPACPLYRQAVMPPSVEDTLKSWSVRPGLRWVERTYAEHRR
jgi:glutathione S-transferase